MTPDVGLDMHSPPRLSVSGGPAGRVGHNASALSQRPPARDGFWHQTPGR